MRQKLKILSGLAALVWLLSLAAAAQTVTAVSVKKESNYATEGPLFATIGGKQVKIADGALQAWIVDGGKSVVFSWTDGAGTGDSRGHSLRIYEAATGKTRRIMAERGDVIGISEVKLSSGGTTILVRLEDAGDGAPSVAIVDPKRGQVLRRTAAEFSEIKGDTAKIVYYQSDDWETIFEPRIDKDEKNRTAIPMKVKARIKRTELIDLKKIIMTKVIVVK